MGGSVSCLCNEGKHGKWDVFMVKEDGELLRFGEGTKVKNVLAGYPSHKVVLCRSDRSALPDSHRLSRRRLYFLLPAGLQVCDATCQRLVRAAGFRDSPFSVPDGNGCRKVPPERGGGEEVVLREVLYFDELGPGKPPWRPSLQTIPEGVSPPVHATK
ncbi:hypothetical protein NMG60_11034357 [Bertholletia excelsa]